MQQMVNLHRFLSLGVKFILLGDAYNCHGPFLQYGSFRSSLEEINDFVEANPTEVVLLFVRVRNS